MRITNVRLGHACNSSSSHSLVFLPPGKSWADDAYARRHKDTPDPGPEYGWGGFFLTTPEVAKLPHLLKEGRGWSAFWWVTRPESR